MLKLTIVCVAILIGTGWTTSEVTRSGVVRNQADQNTLSRQSDLTLSIELDRKTYSLTNYAKLKIILKNESKSPIAIYNKMGWGAFSSLILIVRDLSGKHIIRDLVSDARDLPPFRKEDFSVIKPGESFINNELISFENEGVRETGTYEITLFYHCPVRQEFAPEGLKVWVQEKGNLKSNSITVTVIR